MIPKPHYQSGDKIGGRYLVHEALMGGMGEVYLCLDLKTSLPYALKTFQHRYLNNPKLREAFEHEVTIWIALEKHPNIVRPFHMDIHDNKPFVFLEWIAGEKGRDADLRSWLRYGPINLRLALDFTIDICRGLIHAHKKQPGMVHRDLKPENILVGKQKIAKITDFGLAKILHDVNLEVLERKDRSIERQNIYSSCGIVGTPAYMAPEQWKDEEVDSRTDIYAIGCILFEMLTGKFLFNAATYKGFKRLHLYTSISTLIENNGVPIGVKKLLVRCLAKSKQERYPTVKELLKELSFFYQRQFNKAPKAVINIEKFSVSDYNNRGVTYDRLHRYEEALADYNCCVRLDPDDAISYQNRGTTYYTLRRYEEALADLNKSIQLDKNTAEFYYNRALIYEELQRNGDALVDYNRAIQLAPDFARAYSKRGKLQGKQRNFEKALIDHNQAIQLDPENEVFLTARGITLTQMGHYEEALEDYDHAIRIAPNFASAYSNRSITYYNLHNEDKALSDSDKAIRLDSKDAGSYSNRGLIYLKLEQYNKALDDFNSAIELRPSLVEAYSNRGLTYYRMQHYQKAVENFNEAIKFDPNYALAHYNRGLANYSLKFSENALADFNNAIEIDPNYRDSYIDRGLIYREMNRYKEALEDFNYAIQFDPACVRAYYCRGLVYSDINDYEKAEADFKTTIQLDPAFSSAYFSIGALLFNSDRKQDALPYFEKAAQLGNGQGTELADLVKQEIGKEE